MSDFTVEAFTLLGVGLGVIATRTYARWSQVGWRKFHPDDYLILLAAVVYAAETALAYSVGAYWRGLANNAMTDEERKHLDPNSLEYHLRVNGSKTQVAGWSSYTFLLWLLKTCMCTFYLRLTDSLEGFRGKILAGFALILSTWLAVLFSILFGCGLPFSKNWQIYPDPGNFCQPAVSKLNIFMTLVLNVLTDLYLITIPLPLLWRAKLPPLKKVGLFVCFSGGFFVTGAGVLRCILIVTQPLNGAELAGSWAVRETFVAVVTTNMPMLPKLLQTVVHGRLGQVVKSWSRILHTGYSRQSRGPTPGSYQLKDSDGSWRDRPPPTLYPITNITNLTYSVRDDEDAAPTSAPGPGDDQRQQQHQQQDQQEHQQVHQQEHQQVHQQEHQQVHKQEHQQEYQQQQQQQQQQPQPQQPQHQQQQEQQQQQQLLLHGGIQRQYEVHVVAAPIRDDDVDKLEPYRYIEPANTSTTCNSTKRASR